jgi:hypothetical protein
VLHETISDLYRALAGPPCFQVHGKGRHERDWHVIDIFATTLRNADGRWPLFRGTCITWTSSIIAVGWDFAEELLREQIAEPASRDFPVAVSGGRLHNQAARGLAYPTASEIMAHECGHTGQARRMGILYWLVGAMFTLCREGPHWWNRFENHASETGMFGGIVPGSICDRLRPLPAS